jgi:N-acetylglucosaminyl-diphospho-decaprenol L-rhamnosyltransferase
VEADARPPARSGEQHGPAVGPRATVIIVNYEGRGRLGRCLDALLADESLPFETVVIDNDSRDGSWDEAEERPGVRVVRNPSNVGFGRACNQGAALATTPFLVFLNFDSKPEPGCLAALVETADADDSIGAVQGVVLMPDGTVNTAGNLVHFLGFSWAPIGAAADSPTAAIPVGSAACLLVRRSVFEHVGGFWEEFFLYCEDTDLSWRIRLAGHQIVACSRARTVHEYEFGRNSGKYFHLERNRLLMVGANYRAGTLLRLAPALLATEVAVLGVAVAGGWGRAKISATASAVRSIPRVRARRRAVDRLRAVEEREVTRLFERNLGPEFGRTAARLSRAPLAAYARLARLG